LSIAKSFTIPKELIWQAYQKVKTKGGAAGIDQESIKQFEENLKNNLYRIWNRMSSGSYMPPPVKAVAIPKKAGGERILGVPTVTDRVAQAAVNMILESILDPIFDRDSYGFRKGKSAHEALAITRKRCWENDWVVEFDIKGLFDNINHGMLLKALRRHCRTRWVLLYVERWLKAPMQNAQGELITRNSGTPQGGVVSPILANLFLHYVFDKWVRKTMKDVPFCRYADDGLLHCKSRRQAEFVMRRITSRFSQCGLEIHKGKSAIVYCKDKNRREENEEISFDFLGYTFRPRRCVNGKGVVHPNFLPAVSRTSKKAISREIRSWHIQLKNEKTLVDLSRMFNPVLRGWQNYYGRFYPSAMSSIWRRINWYLAQWVRRKYKRFAKHKRRAYKHVARLAVANTHLFVHWELGCFPGSLSGRSRMS